MNEPISLSAKSQYIAKPLDCEKTIKFKRYIRTTDGKIYDRTTQEIKVDIGIMNTDYDKKHFHISYIVDESDNIFDLLQVGDLVKHVLGDNISYTMKVLMYEEDVNYLKKCNLTELYTKQNDNYTLVWDKERGVI